MGGRGGRGGGRGRGNDMGSHVTSLAQRAPELADASVMKVIAPIGRGDHVDTTKATLPKIEAWRNDNPVGLMLNKTDNQVFCNHFKVDTRKMPPTIHHYNVTIMRWKDDGEYQEEDDRAKTGEKNENTRIMLALFQSLPQWQCVDGDKSKKIGVVYDGCMSFYSSAPLDFSGDNLQEGLEDNSPRRQFTTKISIKGSRAEFRVCLMKVGVVKGAPSRDAGDMVVPTTGENWNESKHQSLLQALDTGLLASIRWDSASEKPSWILSGCKAFRLNNEVFPLSNILVGRKGYYASLKICKAGLVMVSDISFTAFLMGGPVINFVAKSGNYRNQDDLAEDAKRGGAQKIQVVFRAAENELKNCKLRVTHLKRDGKKFRGFGPAANSPDSCFLKNDDDETTRTTVEEYFRNMHEKLPDIYPILKYPYLPTINIGSKARPCLQPIELCEIIEGQARNKILDGRVSAQIIKHAAMLPNDRMNFITETTGGSLLQAIATDRDSEAFGLGEHINQIPICLKGATILPPAKLLYGQGKMIEPELKGTWNLANGEPFYIAPEVRDDDDKCYPYSMVYVYESNKPRGWESQVENFANQLEAGSKVVFAGKRLKLVGDIKSSSMREDDLNRACNECKRDQTVITVLVLNYDAYNTIKMVFDRVGIPTQCIKFQTTSKRNVVPNILMKMNMKMGGVNVALARRDGGTDSSEDANVFQNPPNSISWLFDEACMMVGLDVNHPEDNIGGVKGMGDSVAAMVGSMDGMMGQFAAYVTTCPGKEDVEKGPEGFTTLAAKALLTRFFAKNGRYPKRIIVFRDGVADNQFHDVVDNELPGFKIALTQLDIDSNNVQITIVVCQKRHHTRLIYKHHDTYLNPCAGICVDGRTGVKEEDMDAQVDQLTDSIASSTLNDFYLNSHAAVLGTSKPCKYTLVYDEIGIKMSELELLTYWSTHLYCRCTRSVSYATPAYYAHWAARRGNALLKAGVNPAELRAMTERWLADEKSNAMYFI